VPLTRLSIRPIARDAQSQRSASLGGGAIHVGCFRARSFIRATDEVDARSPERLRSTFFCLVNAENGAADENEALLNICSKCRSNQDLSDVTPQIREPGCDEVKVCHVCGLIFEGKLDADQKKDGGHESKVTSSGGKEWPGSDVEQSGVEPAPQAEPSDPALSERNDTNCENKLPVSESTASLGDQNNSEAEKPRNQTILKLLEKGEKIR